MDFKIDEPDDFEEKNPDNSGDDTDHDDIDENDNDGNYNDNDEFDEFENENTNEEEDSNTPVYEPPEPDESDNKNTDEDEPVEDESDEDTSPIVIEPRMIIPPFNPQEENNFDYADAVRAYYEERNYEYAIEKFGEVIKSEKKGKKSKLTDTNEILAKSLYWQAEAYVKTQDFQKAITTFESLVKTCKEHYLIIAAQRRADSLNAKYSK